MDNIIENHQNNQEPLVSVNLVVYNGEKYIRQCLNSVKKQTRENLEVNILDNNSSDSTREIVKKEFSEFNLIEGEKNLGTWPGQEKLLKYSRGEYIVALSVDVILDQHFIEEAIKVFEKDEKIGAIQPKVFKYELSSLNAKRYPLNASTIDTCGFEVFKSRRIVNIGHGLPAQAGEKDKGQFNQEKAAFAKSYGEPREIFAVEGAVPVLRRQALKDCRLKSQGGKIIDPDFFWYGDDLDLAWRMRLFGWEQIFAPTVVAYHDRQTTKALAGGGWREFIKIRKTVPMFKRQLDWRNTTLAIIKNDFAANFLRDLPFIFWRQLRLWGYFLLFEPAMFLEIFRVAKLLPKMLKRRSEIMGKARVSAKEMRDWFK